ncbi:MAG: 16S rRNA (guanine(527)-N(7))-methyltransferase RsmG [Rhodoferax sp.]|uniref:16S rRNA (guanine(527)-N(7))-methyltransferase RsmG n=1 Tax=Rhodoferax sp. TaxID=50421 RepID=UPI0026134F2E|nr:16S rRNA (guanine(527)-N(7))-methyltransferase RsmG [Rhodoferax sp.]MDD5335410.1 16S rRNA (guanine(527)-N(7))-methyltransferase RsmG [Rhodoferax sp.]
MRPLEADLRAGLRTLALDLSAVQVGQLLDYLALIQKWNKVYNLTALRDPTSMLTHHLLDSLAVVSPLRRVLAGLVRPLVDSHTASFRLLDVGAGAGLPGVVIAVCCPEVAVTCVDAVAKKAAFVQQAAVTLKLPNLRGLHGRVEAMTPGSGEGYDIVSSRAFASLAEFTRWSSAALAAHGAWLAMKGKVPDEEIALLPPEVKVFHVEQLLVPALPAERCIVWMQKTSTPLENVAPKNLP